MAIGISIVKIKLGAGYFKLIEKTIDSSKPKCQVTGDRYRFNTEYRVIGTVHDPRDQKKRDQ